MRIRAVSLVVAAGFAAANFLMAVPGWAQQSSTKIPRAVDGHPNLNGIWQAFGTANWDLQDHTTYGGPYWQIGSLGAAPSGIGVVEGGVIPYKPAALKQKEENFANRWKLDPEVKCYMPGIPRATYMPYPFQIVQSSNAILMAYEYASTNRVINMDKPVEAQVDSWMGTANGHWEGDTLVVDNTGFNDQSWFDRAGDFHSDALHVVERYTLMDPDHLEYEATIEDPNVFTRPWKIRMPLYRHVEKDARLAEFKCVEFAEQLLYGNLAKKPAGK